MIWISEEEYFDLIGAWCYYPNAKEYKITHAALAEKIYTYIQQEILQRSANKCVFSIPSEFLEMEVVLKNPDEDDDLQTVTKKLWPMTVVYEHSEKLTEFLPLSSISSSSNKNKEIEIKINVDVLDKDFKSLFIDELKHIWKYTFEQVTFEDWIKIDDSKTLDNIKDMFKIVYAIDPDEFNSFENHIYSYAYQQFMNNKNLKICDIVTEVKQKFCYNNKSISIIDNINNNYKEELKTYFIYLWTYNVKSNGRKSRRYIFSDISNYVEAIPKYSDRYNNIKSNAKDFSWINELAKLISDTYNTDEPEFVDALYQSGLNNIKRYIKKYRADMYKIIRRAYIKAQHDINMPKKYILTNLGFVNSDDLDEFSSIFSAEIVD